MTLESVRDILLGGGGLLLILATLIQITPIKINPWSWMAKHLGRAINGEVLKEVNVIKGDVKELKENDAEQWASLSRTHILRFGDEILHGVVHSKEHFDQILIDISKYEAYCKDHPEYLNNIANATIHQIKRTYQKCLDEGSFL